eukprot:gene4887-6095_t
MSSTQQQQGHQPIVRPLYGGAIEVILPKRFIDISQYRQVPDHQEVFVDEHTEQSVIIELLERQPVSDQESLSFHYNVICEEAGILPEKRILVNSRAITTKEMPNFPDSFPKYLLLAQQKVAKFNETAENTINVYMAIVRLERAKTDLLITLNEAIEISPESSSINAVKTTTPSSDHTLIESLFLSILNSFKIKDYGLFQNQ